MIGILDISRCQPLQNAAGDSRPSRKLRLYLLLLAIALPMDWFAWTGAILREAGARPAIPLMTVASIYVFLTKANGFARDLPPPINRILLVFALIALCGMVAFVINLVCSWSYFGGAKDPVIQAITQTALYLLVPFILIAHTVLLRQDSTRSLFLSYIPIAAGIHLGCMLLEAIGFLQPVSFPLSLFRVVNEGAIGVNTNRLAGLFSEPSYFGAMAAMYGLPLLLIQSRNKYLTWLRQLMAISLFASALIIGAKTVIPVLICGYLAYLWQTRTTIFTFRKTLAVALVAAASILTIKSTATFDIQDNLSSAMRFGSTVTALNIAKSGYGLTGLGFGQFHFMFKPQFVPDFLFLSQEAEDQMSVSAEHRASTYNLFARYLVETGIIGFALWMYLLAQFAKLARSFHSRDTVFGALLMGSALGFLLTQDPYCFPPLILAMAFILAGYYSHLSPTLRTEPVR